MSELVNLVNSEGVAKVRNIPRHEIGRYSDLHLEIVIAVVFDSLRHVLATQRSWNKKSAPGCIDHICGAMIAGTDQTPEEAALRESQEEAGVSPTGLYIADSRVNSYGHYRHLVVGYSNAKPNVTRPQEVEWAAYHPPDTLRQWHALAQASFVAGYFEDLSIAEQTLTK